MEQQDYQTQMDSLNQLPVSQKEDSSMYTGMIQQGQNKELIEWILSPDDMIDKFVNQFAGRVFNPSTGQWEEKYPEDVIMNDAGIRYWKSIMLSVLNKNTIMTRYDDYKQIQRLAEPLVARSVIVAELDKKRLGMKSMHIDLMREALSNQVIATLLRGLKSGERDFLNLTTQLKSTIQEPKKQGLLGSLFGMKR